MADFRIIQYKERTFQSFGFYLKKGTPLYDFIESGVETNLIQGSVNGEVITNRSGVANIERTFSFKTIPSKIPYPEDKFLKAYVAWLQEGRGEYQKLYDSAKEGYYCEALLKNIDSLQKYYEGCYETSVTFSCKPFWYSKIGQEPIVKTTNQNLFFYVENPEAYNSYPLFKITCENLDEQQTQGIKTSFRLRVNSKDFSVNDFFDMSSATILIDSEIKKITQGIEVDYKADGEYPVFKSGENVVSFFPDYEDTYSETNAKYTIEIIPRWRCV